MLSLSYNTLPLTISYHHPTNTSRGFHVETTWKRSFPRLFNMESTCCVCRAIPVFDWLIFCCRNLILYQKRNENYKSNFFVAKQKWQKSICKHNIAFVTLISSPDPWCNMLQTEKIWYEIVSGTHSYLPTEHLIFFRAYSGEEKVETAITRQNVGHVKLYFFSQEKLNMDVWQCPKYTSGDKIFLNKQKLF